MKTIKNAVSILVIMFISGLVFGPVWADESVVAENRWELELGSWRNSLEGDLTTQNTPFSLANTTIDDHNSIFFKGRYQNSPISSIFFRYFSSKQTGQYSDPAGFTFQGQNFAVNADLAMDLTGMELLWHYHWHRPESSEEHIDWLKQQGYLDAVVGLKYFDVDVEVNGTVAGVAASDSYSEKFPIPVIGIAGGSKIDDRFSVGTHIHFFNFKRSDDKVKLIDWDIHLQYMLGRVLEHHSDWGLKLGYKYLNLDGSASNDAVDIKYKGPYFKVVGRF